MGSVQKRQKGRWEEGGVEKHEGFFRNIRRGDKVAKEKKSRQMVRRFAEREKALDGRSGRDGQHLTTGGGGSEPMSEARKINRRRGRTETKGSKLQPASRGRAFASEMLVPDNENRDRMQKKALPCTW